VTKKIYGAAVLGLIAVVALTRFDLVVLAAETTLAGLRRGGKFQAQLIGQILLFGSILAFTAWIIPQKAELKKDAAAVGFALVLGFLVEAWGTRLGLWSYYTGEKPPLWIVPSWPLGALVIDRMADTVRCRVRGALSPATIKSIYFSLALVTLGGFFSFTGDAVAHPATLAVGALLAGALLLFPEPEKDLPVLVIGAVCVFFADLWGTMNNCWVYHVQQGGGAIRHAVSVLFGMFFDTTVVLACLRGPRLLFRHPGARALPPQ